MKAGMAFRGVGPGLFAPDRTAEAIALYDEIRRVDPVFRLADTIWLLTHYDDAKAVPRDTRFSSSDEWDTADTDHDDTSFGIARSILWLDPPERTRLRGLVQQAFLPDASNSLRTASNVPSMVCSMPRA